MNPIRITGASQRVSRNGVGEWFACYHCHKCGDEFAGSSEFCRDEQTAREESNTLFDRQQRRFCHRCGYKLTTSEPAPESERISELNKQIDKLQSHGRELWDRVKLLEDVINGLSSAERTAIKNGWIKMALSDYDEEAEAALEEGKSE